MRFPREVYQMQQTIGDYFPDLRPAQCRGLALWVYGTILAQSACQSAVVGALVVLGSWHAVRQYLREWLYDGADKAAPCRTEVTITACFAPLVRWVLSWWQSQELALAVDATAHGDRLVALVVSVLYRSSAIPVAWVILPGNEKGAWIPHLLRLLRLLRPAVPRTMTVLVLADRGLWSPRLWKRIRDLGWHPLLRVQDTVTFQPDGQERRPVRQLVPGPGHAWVGHGVAFKHRPVRRAGTLLIVWGEGEAEPWVVLTDLPARRVGVSWYGLRAWVEVGFRALKGVGWQWEHTRRTNPARVERHWLVLAAAMLWVLAYGTRAEDAQRQGRPPGELRAPLPPAAPQERLLSVFQHGLSWLRWRLLRGRLWRRLWLTPEAWPEAPPGLQTVYHGVA